MSEKFDVFVFDAYGTLFDVTGPARAMADLLDDRAGDVARIWRDKQIQYLLLRSLMGSHAPFSEVTADALDYALEVSGIDPEPVRAELLSNYRRIEPFHRAQSTLQGLKERGATTCILSNGDEPMLEEAAEASGLRPYLDAILSVEAVGINKPHPHVYQLVERHFGVPPGEAVFVSSNGWDAHGAAHFGFNVAWLTRYPQPRERLPGEPRWNIRCLDNLLDLEDYAIDRPDDASSS